MKLYIDTTNSETITIKINEEVFHADARHDRAQALLPLVLDTLASRNIKITQITEIEVNRGPGSFTGTRVGVSVANALGWALGVPVNGSKEQFTQINYASKD